MNIKLALLIFIMSASVTFGQTSSKFKVVLDAGHGGKDYGAIYHGFIEKNIALNVALKVGKILEKDSQIDVVYTRKTDVFIELNERANIANNEKASIFVSVHCNGAANQTAYGTETFVMGLTRNASALEVAKKENDVVSMEKDYKMKYNGYDPNKPESLIGLKIMLEENLDQSIMLASKVEEGISTKLDRKSRGVKQAGFLVLRNIYMPRILIELGFISNKNEGQFLNSDAGQDKVARQIADAILSYKKEYFIPVTQSTVTPQPVKESPQPQAAPAVKETVAAAPQSAKSGVVFKVQIAAVGKDLPTTPENFNGLSNISKISTPKYFKYFYGETNDLSVARQLQQEARAKGYDTAYIVAFENGEVITMDEALKKR